MRYLIGLCLLTVLLSATTVSADEHSRTISVKGEASASAAPDKADLSVNLFGQGRTAAIAKKESDEKLKSLYQLAKKYQLDTSAIRTNQSSIQPRYDYRDGKRIFREYQSQQRITIEIDRLENVADINDALVDAGVDRVESLQYGIKDMAALKQAALVKALEQAMGKAKALANVANARLGDVLTIQENGARYVQPRPIARNMLMKAESMSAASDAAVAPPAGDVEVNQTIQVVFELN